MVWWALKLIATQFNTIGDDCEKFDSCETSIRAYTR